MNRHSTTTALQPTIKTTRKPGVLGGMGSGRSPQSRGASRAQALALWNGPGNRVMPPRWRSCSMDSLCKPERYPEAQPRLAPRHSARALAGLPGCSPGWVVLVLALARAQPLPVGRTVVACSPGHTRARAVVRTHASVIASTHTPLHARMLIIDGLARIHLTK